MMNKLKDTTIYRTGMMGVIVGDALGCPVQFHSRTEVAKNPITGMRGYGTFNVPAGSWTDDSSLTLATYDSLRTLGRIDLDDIMNRFMDWLYAGAYTPYDKAYDVGNCCRSAIADYSINHNPKTCGPRRHLDNGNGSLMRILPVCIYVYDQVTAGKMTEDMAVDLVHQVSALTHGHRRSKMCCGFYYFMVKHILNDRTDKSLIDCLQDGINDGVRLYSGNDIYQDQLDFVRRLTVLDQFKGVSANRVSSSGYVIDTIEAAVWSLITTDSLKDALLTAVNLGDDTDTVGAIAGGLAALYYGYDAIPADWIQAIQKKDWIDDLIG